MTEIKKGQVCRKERSTVTNTAKATKRRDHFDKQVLETTGGTVFVEQ